MFGQSGTELQLEEQETPEEGPGLRFHFNSPIMPTQPFHSGLPRKIILVSLQAEEEPRATDQLLKQMIHTQQPVMCAAASSQ